MVGPTLLEATSSSKGGPDMRCLLLLALEALSLPVGALTGSLPPLPRSDRAFLATASQRSGRKRSGVWR
eukprot:632170-Pyramimonas_sp.AAC.1